MKRGILVAAARLLILCQVCSQVLGTEAQNAVVKLTSPSGKVRGIKVKAAGSEYLAFYGVPYAVPPIDHLRFRPPQALESLQLFAKRIENGVLDATSFENFPLCPQVIIHDRQGRLKPPVVGEEDCLVLNVYVPGEDALNGPPSMPVMVHFHGGNFLFGSSDPAFYGPDYFFSEDARGNLDVILITLNYRLGVLGFLTTESIDIPGNLGLRDQNLALRWVRDNVHNFGGDPRKVTIFGSGAGGKSVMFHLLSPKSATLFRGAISQSGPVGVRVPSLKLSKSPSHYSSSLAWEVGCEDGGREATAEQHTLQCLQRCELETLVEQGTMFETFMSTGYPWVPLVDRTYAGDDAFLPDEPQKLLEAGQINKVIGVMCGGNLNEGSLFVPQFTAYNNSRLAELEKEYNELGPNMFLGLDRDDVTEADAATANLIRIEYLNGNVTSDKLPELETMMTDLLFLIPIDQQVKLLSKAQVPVYYFNYRFKGALSTPHSRFLLADSDYESGVSHGDETFVLFRQRDDWLEGKRGPRDHAMSKLLVGMWKNFAHAGTPEGRWKPLMGPLSEDEGRFVVIDENMTFTPINDERFRKSTDFVNSLFEIREFFEDLEFRDHPAFRKLKEDAEEEEEEEEADAKVVRSGRDDDGRTVMDEITDFISDKTGADNLGAFNEMDLSSRDQDLGGSPLKDEL